MKIIGYVFISTPYLAAVFTTFSITAAIENVGVRERYSGRLK